MTIQERIKNLQNLPENKKKLVFFSVIAVFGLVLLAFSIKDTKDGISKIGYSLQNINLPPINMPDYKAEMPNIDLSGFSAQLEALSEGQTAEFKEYKSEEYGFEIKHPESWAVNTELISKDELNLARNAVEKETAGIHVELISQTEKITSAQAGIEKIMLEMKEVMVEKREIMVGGYKGYEIVGTLCTQKVCSGAKGETYAPFSVMYFGDEKNLFEVQYGEGVIEVGWKENIIDWKFYEEYKNIISTFTYNK